MKATMKNVVYGFFALCALWLAAAALAQPQQQPEAMLRAGMHKETVDGDLQGAIETYRKLAQSANRAVAAQALVRMGQCYEKLGDTQAQEARKAYQRVVREFADQAEIVAQARVRLAALGGPGAAGELVTRRVLADASGVYGVLTPDGKYISHIDGGTGDVVQFEVASGQTRRITNRGPWSETEHSLGHQLFSRDGKQIAYDSWPKENDYVNPLWIRNLDGSGLRTLYSEKNCEVRPLDWSPDGGSILAILEREKNDWRDELTLISTADGSLRVLNSDIPWAWRMLKMARFSPDGRFVAYSVEREGSPPHGDLFLMTADGRNEVVVAGHPAEDHLLGWTPDGTSLVFLSDRSGTWDIWTVHITGGKQQGEPELLKKDFGYYSGVLGFAPDGSFYYKTGTALGRLYYCEVDLETGKVLVPPAPVTTRYTGLPYRLTWSPDGRKLAYIIYGAPTAPGNSILAIRSAATGEERFLSPRVHSVTDISWAPDGRSVIASGMTEKNTGAFRIDTETSGITKLRNQAFFPHLCPDGKTLVFEKGRIVKKRNLDTGEESEVVKVGMVSYDLSPDGREVVFQLDGAVKIVSLNGGEPRELFRGLAKYYWLQWTRDGRYIIAAAFGTATVSSEIWRVAAQGGTPLKLDLSVPKMAFFTLHPDNRRFAFSALEKVERELWVLENFLPAAARTPAR
jgi:Tol biopolymer transport system component